LSAPLWLGINIARHRWLFPAAGALSTTLIGAAYAFSVFVRPLEAEFGWQRPQTTAAFSIAMLLFGLFAFVGGAIVDRWGPRLPYVVGACLMAMSQILAARVTTLPGLLFSYGVLLGAGIGLVYGAVTVPLMARWYPDTARRGVAIGTSLMGMGIGSLLAAPLWTWSIAQFGWRPTYTANGVVFLVVLGFLATLIRFPPAGWAFHPGTGWQPTPASAPPTGAALPAADLNLRVALGRPQFALVALLFFLTVFGGMMVIGQLAAFAAEPAPAGPGLGLATAAKLVMILALFNGIGRPAWGWIAGRIGPRWALATCPLLMTAAMALFALGHTAPVLALAAALCGFSFGGTLALVPIMTTALFGPAFVGRVYGLIYFLGLGGGGFLGPPTGAWMHHRYGDYDPAFALSAAMATLAALLAATLLPPRGREHLGRVASPSGPAGLPTRVT
jgi:MFS family permease